MSSSQVNCLTNEISLGPEIKLINRKKLKFYQQVRIKLFNRL